MRRSWDPILLLWFPPPLVSLVVEYTDIPRVYDFRMELPPNLKALGYNDTFPLFERNEHTRSTFFHDLTVWGEVALLKCVIQQFVGFACFAEVLNQPHLIAEPTWHYEPPLIHAVMGGQHEKASLLLEAKADVNYRSKTSGGNFTGWTPLARAVLNGDQKMMSLLLEHRAQVEIAIQHLENFPYYSYTLQELRKMMK